MSQDHDITPLLGQSIHASSFPVIVLVSIIVAVKVVGGVIAVLLTVLMPITAPMSAIVMVGREDLTMSGQSA